MNPWGMNPSTKHLANVLILATDLIGTNAMSVDRPGKAPMSKAQTTLQVFRASCL